jgi:hypothetical protein
MAMEDSSALDTFERILSRWWLLALLTVLGGLSGWLINFIKPPVYEARASMVVNMVYTGRAASTDQTSWLLSSVASMVSPRVLGPELIPEYAEVCKGITNADLQLERRESVWELVARCSNPQGAADLANAWLDLASTTLSDALVHSLNVEALTTSLELLKTCKNFSTQEVCKGFTNVEALQQQIKSLQNEITIEQQASQGIIPSISFRIESHADIPESPSARATGILILAGMVMGMMAGILVITLPSRPPSKKKS